MFGVGGVRMGDWIWGDDCDVLIDGYECKNILDILFVCIYTCLYYK